MLKTLLLRALAVVCLCVPILSASPHRDRGMIYNRIICVVPMVGAGTVQDPKRPMFTSANGNETTGDDNRGTEGIIAFQSIPTDDGQAAIVVFVARTYEAFKPILTDPNVIRKFERKDVDEDHLVKELRKYKKDFTLQMLRVEAL